MNEDLPIACVAQHGEIPTCLFWLSSGDMNTLDGLLAISNADRLDSDHALLLNWQLIYLSCWKRLHVCLVN